MSEDAAATPPAPTGGKLGRFELLRPLGRGGMGAVLEAYDRMLDRKVAVKQLHGEGGRGHQERLLREAQALARLSHPNVVQVYDAGEADGRLFIAMELIAGRTLDEWQCEAHDWRTCVDVYLQAGRGLAAAHAAGIVHRDFKPANCIIDAEGRVRVLDFGLARGVGGEEDEAASTGSDPAGDEASTGASDTNSSALASSSAHGPGASNPAVGILAQQLTRTGAMLGTPAYMAPEQMRRRAVDARCDQYGLCVSLYEALHGVRPYDGVEGMIRLFAGEPPSFAPARAGRVPTWLRRLLVKGLALDPDARFASMDALLTTIEGRRRRQQRRRIGAAVLGLGLVSTSVAFAALREVPCAGMREAPMPAWTSEQRDAVEQALRATSSALAEPAWASVREAMDDYAARWVDARAGACEASRVERSMSEEVLDLRLACLDRSAVHVTAMVEQLRAADDVVVAHAGQAVRSLPPIAGCMDVELLRSGPKPLPEQLRAQADEVRRAMAASWAAGVSGRTNQGLMMAELAVLDADELGDEAPQVLAEARLNRGRMFRYAQRISDARTDLERVVELAEQTGDQALALDALRDLATSASAADDLLSVAALMPVIRGKLRRFPDRPRYEADRRTLEGLLATGQGKHEQAAAELEAAVATYRSFGAEATAELCHALVQLGRVRFEGLGLDDEARQVLEEAASLAERDGLFPLVVMALDQLAHLHHAHGRTEQAETAARGALQLVEQIHGPEAPGALTVLALLAELAQQRGRMDAAHELLERARNSLGPQTPAPQRAKLYQQIAAFEFDRGDLERSLAANRSARDAWSEAPSPDPIRLAKLDSDMGDCLMLLGRLDAAVASYQRSLASLELHATETDHRRVFPLLGLGHVLVEQGQVEQGRAHLQRAWELEQRAPPDASLSALIQSELGNAILRSASRDPDEIREAVALLEAAMTYSSRAGDAESVKAIEAILAECGSRCSSGASGEASQ